jgi:hypothetical protein
MKMKQNKIANNSVQAHYFIIGMQQAMFFGAIASSKPCNIEKFMEAHFNTIEGAEEQYSQDAYDWFVKGFEYYKAKFGSDKPITKGPMEYKEYSADEWQLYSSSMDCTEAVKGLNYALRTSVDEFNKSVRDGVSRKAAFEAVMIGYMYPAMHKYMDFGATDTEPREFVHSLFEKTLGDFVFRW